MSSGPPGVAWLSPARAGDEHDGGEPLRRDEKERAIAALSERLTASGTIFAADFRGLTVKQLAELRGRLREAETEFTVVKNTLARRAASDSRARRAAASTSTGPPGWPGWAAIPRWRRRR